MSNFTKEELLAHKRMHEVANEVGVELCGYPLSNNDNDIS